jgi:hypothetical protein
MSRERRSYPRYPVELSVLVEVPSERCTFRDATASNLSRTSIQFSCHADLVAALLQQQVLPYTCELRFRLPWHKHEFKLKAQVVTHRRLSQQEYVLVLLFRHEDENQELLLDRLLASQQSVGLS